MADLIFYNKVVSLDSRIHHDLRVNPQGGYAFAAKTNSVPVVGIEFADTSREYPIAFVKAQGGVFLPVALLGLREDENLFVDGEGRWDARYIPAFVRRYPFVPAEAEQGEVVICIDEAAACLNREEGEPLFAGDQPSAYLQNMLNLMREYQAHAQRSQEFCKHLQENDLLVESNAQAQLPDGTAFNLSGLFVVDEKRLLALDKEKVHALFAQGELGLIYAHLMSLGNLQRLVEKLGTRLQG
ncbi:MAG: SapC family protein [Rhodocyclaceae bacterium]|nr:SapC family protein [Rhodocyclaceae bacterium]